MPLAYRADLSGGPPTSPSAAIFFVLVVVLVLGPPPLPHQSLLPGLMIASSLIFSNTHWIWLAVTAVVFGLWLLIWSYRAALSGPLRWLCIILKLFAVAALAFCFLEPLWSSQRAKPGANLFAIVRDKAQGL